MNRFISKRLTLPLLTLLLLAGVARSQELEAIGTAYSENIFLKANVADAKAATKVWVDRLGAESQICRAGDVFIYKTPEEWIAAAEKKTFTLAVVQTAVFLALEEKGIFDPCFVFENSGGCGEEFVLLAHRDGGIGSLADLAGKELGLGVDYDQDLADHWLKGIMDGIPFGIQIKEKPSATILSVFFKSSDACVVARSSYEVMKELNPQVGRDLVELARSPTYVGTVVCLSSDCDPEFKRRMCETLEKMHNQVEGQQVLMSFKVDRFYPYRSELIETVRELLRPEKAASENGTEHDIGSDE